MKQKRRGKRNLNLFVPFFFVLFFFAAGGDVPLNSHGVIIIIEGRISESKSAEASFVKG